MRFTYFIIFVILSFVQHKIYASEKFINVHNQNNPLTIGDKVPDVVLNNIINYKTNSAKLSSFNGKVIILEFFATWCSSCLKGINKMDNLQQQFSNTLQVVLVNATTTGDDEKKVIAFFDKHRNGNNEKFSMPAIISDSVISTLFPHKLIPHYVWLNKNREVVAITSDKEVTAANIKTLVGNKKLMLPMKKDILDYNPRLSLLENGNGGNGEALLNQSVFTSYLPGISSGVKRIQFDAMQKITCLNFSAFALYTEAVLMPSNKIKLEFKDSSNLNQFLNKQRLTNNIYCYELTVPLKYSQKQIQQKMLLQLNENLGYYARMDNRKMKCWVLQKAKDNQVLINTKGGKPYLKWADKGDSISVINNRILGVLISYLNNIGDAIVIDETGINGPVDLKLDAPLNDFVALKKDLEGYGLLLIEEERLVEVLVISETASGK